MIVANASGATVLAPGGNVWIVPDAGRPLDSYSPESSDPGKIWRTQPSVRKVVGFAARQIAQLPWHAFQRRSDGDRVRLSDSLAEKLLRQPSRFVSGYQLIESLVIDQMVCDRYLALYFNDELVRIPPHRWTVKSNWLGQVTQIILLTPAGQDDVDITAAPIVVGWGWSENSAGGISPLVTLSELLEENRRSVSWRKNQWDNSPQFGGILKHPGSLKDAKRERFTEDWKNWMEGKTGTPLLEDGMDYLRAPQLSPKDARDIEGRELTDIEVCGAFYIPPELVGVRPGNFSNMVAFRSMLFGPTLGPGITSLSQAINAGLVPAADTRPDVYVEAAREAAINGSLMEQAQILQTSIGAPWMLRSEGRAKFNLPFIEGTDELVTPLNVLEGGQASATDSGAQNRKTAPSPRRALVRKAAEEGTDDDEADDIRVALERDLAVVLAGQAEELLNGAINLDTFVEKWASANSAVLFPGLKAAALLAAQRVLADNPTDDWAADVMDGYLEQMADTTGAKMATGAAEAFDPDQEDPDIVRAAIGAGAVTWAATGTAEAMGFGGNDAAKAASLTTKTWVVTSSNPRPSHAAMDGETVALDDVFSNGARWPGEAGLDADETAGCTCQCTYNS